MRAALIVLILFTTAKASAVGREVISASLICEQELSAPTRGLLRAQKTYAKKAAQVTRIFQLRNLVRKAGDFASQQTLLHMYFGEHPDATFEFVTKSIRRIFSDREDQAVALLGYMELQLNNNSLPTNFVRAATWMRQLTDHRRYVIFGPRDLKMPDIVRRYVEMDPAGLTRDQLTELAKADPENARTLYLIVATHRMRQRSSGIALLEYVNQLGPELFSATLLKILHEEPKYLRDPQEILRLADESSDPQAVLKEYLAKNHDLLSQIDLRRISLSAGTPLPDSTQPLTVNLSLDEILAATAKGPTRNREVVTAMSRASEPWSFYDLARVAALPGMDFDTLLTPKILDSVHKLSLASQASLFLEGTIGSRDEREAIVRDAVFLPALNTEPPPIFTIAELLNKIENEKIQTSMLRAYIGHGRVPGDPLKNEAKLLAAMDRAFLIPSFLLRNAGEISLKDVLSILLRVAENPPTLTLAIDNYLGANQEAAGDTNDVSPQIKQLIAANDPRALLLSLMSEPPGVIRHALILQNAHAVATWERQEREDIALGDRRRTRAINDNYLEMSTLELGESLTHIYDSKIKLSAAKFLVEHKEMNFEELKPLLEAIPSQDRADLLTAFILKHGHEGAPIRELAELAGVNDGKAEPWLAYADSQIEQGQTSPSEVIPLLKRANANWRKNQLLQRYFKEGNPWSANDLALFMSEIGESSGLNLVSDYVEHLRKDSDAPVAQILPYLDLLADRPSDRDALIENYLTHSPFLGFESESTNLLLARVQNDELHDTLFMARLQLDAKNLGANFVIEQNFKKLRLPENRGRLVYSYVVAVKLDSSRILELSDLVEHFDPERAREIRRDRMR